MSDKQIAGVVGFVAGMLGGALATVVIVRLNIRVGTGESSK